LLLPDYERVQRSCSAISKGDLLLSIEGGAGDSMPD